MTLIVPEDIPISRVRGDTFPMTFQLKDSAGSPIDITSFTFVLTVDPNEDPPDAGANLFALIGTITDAPNGKFQFPISAGEANQTPGDYYYDVEMVDGASAKRTIIKSTFVFTQDISK